LCGSTCTRRFPTTTSPQLVSSDQLLARAVLSLSSGLCAGCSNRRCAAGVDFALKLIRWDDHTQVRLQLWDIAGTGPSSSARDLTTLTLPPIADRVLCVFLCFRPGAIRQHDPGALQYQLLVYMRPCCVAHICCAYRRARFTTRRQSELLWCTM
jgi:hypothetical protein